MAVRLENRGYGTMRLFEYASNYNNTVFHTDGRKNGERGISRCAERTALSTT